MARKLRLQYPGAIYHVMNRGDHSEVIFRQDKDRELLLATLSEACQKTDWQGYGLCFIPAKVGRIPRRYSGRMCTLQVLTASIRVK